MGAMSNLVNKLVATGNLEEEELTELLQCRNEETFQYLYEQAQMICNKKKNKKVEIWEIFAKMIVRCVVYKEETVL